MLPYFSLLGSHSPWPFHSPAGRQENFGKLPALKGTLSLAPVTLGHCLDLPDPLVSLCDGDQSLPWGCGEKQGTDVEGIQVVGSALQGTGNGDWSVLNTPAAPLRLKEPLGV